MPEIANFVRKGSSRISLKTVRNVASNIALWKLEFTQIEDPTHPHLVDQLEMLSNVVEDFAENAVNDMPLNAIAAATFALIYAHKKMDILPDFLVEHGHGDDSAVVRAALMMFEREFQIYAEKNNISWDEVTTGA